MSGAERNAPFDLRDAQHAAPLGERLQRLFGLMDYQLQLAVDTINSVLGLGYAEKHPQLIAALLQANALHGLSEGLDDRLLWIWQTFRQEVDVLDDLKGVVRQLGKGEQ